MSTPLIKFEITANSVAWYAAIVSTFAMAISLYGTLRDRIRIKIKYQKDMQPFGENTGYDPKKTYVNITVINTGRRPANITKAALRIFGSNKKYGLLADSFLTNRNRVLTEATPTTEFMWEQDESVWRNVWFIIVYDATGRSYRKYVHPFLPILRFFRK